MDIINVTLTGGDDSVYDTEEVSLDEVRFYFIEMEEWDEDEVEGLIDANALTCKTREDWDDAAFQWIQTH